MVNFTTLFSRPTQSDTHSSAPSLVSAPDSSELVRWESLAFYTNFLLCIFGVEFLHSIRSGFVPCTYCICLNFCELLSSFALENNFWSELDWHWLFVRWWHRERTSHARNGNSSTSRFCHFRNHDSLHLFCSHGEKRFQFISVLVNAFMERVQYFRDAINTHIMPVLFPGLIPVVRLAQHAIRPGPLPARIRLYSHWPGNTSSF